MEEQYFLVQIISPFVALKDQTSKTFISTTNNLQEFGAGLLKIGSLDRFLLLCEGVVVVKEYDLKRKDDKGISETVETSMGVINIMYTELVLTLLYVKTTSESEVYIRGYYAEFKNLAKITRDGYIPIDKSLGWGNISIVEHNKRTLIKKGALYIHNHSNGIMAFVDKYFSTYEEMLRDCDEPNKKIDLKYYLECILY